MKIIIAIDSFKGSLTSIEAEQAVEKSIKELYPACHTTLIPIGDGGEGTLSVILNSVKGKTHTIQASNPCMEIISAPYGISADGSTAFIEMANISGLPLIKKSQQNPMETTTYGTGELIKDALEKGCTKFIIGIGGSATNDAGTGLLQALGFVFKDKQGKRLGHGGKILGEISHIDKSDIHPLLKDAHFTIACDVQNTFYGPNGAAHTFARQKGANDDMIEHLDEGMRSFAKIILRETGKDISQLPGSGAAGGVGGGLAAFLDAELKSGADLLLEASRFYAQIEQADLIITGEGQIDKQTLMGKIPGKILQAGKAKNIPVIAIVGGVKDKPDLLKAGFKDIYAIKPDEMDLAEAMKPEATKQNIRATIARIPIKELVPPTK